MRRVSCDDQVDDRQPMQREWALLTVRNMCDGSPEVQAEVAALKAVGIVQAPELAALGVKAELTEEGKVRLTRTP